jgi:hypothetical protein
VCFELFFLIVSVSQQDETALHTAVRKGHLPVVEFLLEHAPQLIEMLDEVSAAWYVYGCSL